MAETWRVVLASGEVRSYRTERVDYPGEPSLWRARGDGWLTPGAYALTERAAVCAASSTVPASDLVEILAPGELTRAELRAQAWTAGAEAMRRDIVVALTPREADIGRLGRELGTIHTLPAPPCPEVSR